MSIENPIRDDSFNVQEYLDSVFDILGIDVEYKLSEDCKSVTITQTFSLLKTKDGPNKWCGHLHKGITSFKYYSLEDVEYKSYTLVNDSSPRYKIVDFGNKISKNDPFKFKTVVVEDLRYSQNNGDSDKDLVFNISRIYGKTCEDFRVKIPIPKGYIPTNAIPKPDKLSTFSIVHTDKISPLIPYNLAFVIRKSMWAKYKVPAVYLSSNIVWGIVNAFISLVLGIMILGG